MSTKIHAVVLKQRPVGMPDPEKDFGVIEINSLPELKPNHIKVDLLTLSMDPFLRGRMSRESGSYVSAFELDKPIEGFAVGRVVQSTHKHFKPGHFVTGIFPWQTQFVHDPSTSLFTRKIDKTNGEEDPKTVVNGLLNRTKSIKTMSQAPGIGAMMKWFTGNSSDVPNFIGNSFPLTYSTSILGMPGLTAWLGFMKLCDPQKDETLFVSAASGAVGSIVCQLGKMKGLKVIGSAGSDAKCNYLKSELNVDEVINYKTCGNIEEALKKAAPNGIDCYFDNVGGETLDAVLNVANPGARFAICGMISQYNVVGDEGYKMKNIVQVLVKSISIRGFIVDRLIRQYGTTEAILDLVEGLASNKIKYTEDIMNGSIADAPKCFVRMLKGDNFGKQQLRLVN